MVGQTEMVPQGRRSRNAGAVVLLGEKGKLHQVIKQNLVDEFIWVGIVSNRFFSSYDMI